MGWNTLDGAAPWVIAHRGASGALPEHTLAAYALGLAQGADVIEPDLVPTADGVLIARHEPALERSTDVRGRAEFAALRGADDWLSTDFSLEQVSRLRARQPFEGRDTHHDGLHAVPSWPQVLQWATAAAAERGRPVRLYPELKHPARFAGSGLDPVPMFADSIAPASELVEIAVQCFEAAPLRRVFEASGRPCSLLLESTADWRAVIVAHGSWLHGLGVDKRLLWDGHGRSSGLVEAAHAAGLRVHPWTYRDDRIDHAYADVREELAAAMDLGVDALFCDFPATAVAVREERLLHACG